MHTEYRKEYSRYLDREVEFKIYGHSGKPCLVFPPQDGKFTDYENFRMVETLSDYIEQGRLQLFCVDSVDRESWSDKEGNPRYIYVIRHRCVSLMNVKLSSSTHIDCELSSEKNPKNIKQTSWDNCQLTKLGF